MKTEQLQQALLSLYRSSAIRAYQLAYDELQRRMGAVAFHVWRDQRGLT